MKKIIQPAMYSIYGCRHKYNYISIHHYLIVTERVGRSYHVKALSSNTQNWDGLNSQRQWERPLAVSIAFYNCTKKKIPLHFFLIGAWKEEIQKQIRKSQSLKCQGIFLILKTKMWWTQGGKSFWSALK